MEQKSKIQKILLHHLLCHIPLDIWYHIPNGCLANYPCHDEYYTQYVAEDWMYDLEHYG